AQALRHGGLGDMQLLRRAFKPAFFDNGRQTFQCNRVPVTHRKPILNFISRTDETAENLMMLLVMGKSADTARMNIIVLGAGIIGISTAWHLRERGHQVTVVDRQSGPALETSYANGGQISVSYCEPWANRQAPWKAL